MAATIPPGAGRAWAVACALVLSAGLAGARAPARALFVPARAFSGPALPRAHNVCRTPAARPLQMADDILRGLDGREERGAGDNNDKESLSHTHALLSPRSFSALSRSRSRALPPPTPTNPPSDGAAVRVAGAPLGCDFLSAALAALGGAAAPASVTNAQVEAGSENKFPTSHSAVLSLQQADGAGGPRRLFVKKVSAEAMKHKPWPDRRRCVRWGGEGATCGLGTCPCVCTTRAPRTGTGRRVRPLAGHIPARTCSPTRMLTC